MSRARLYLTRRFSAALLSRSHGEAGSVVEVPVHDHEGNDEITALSKLKNLLNFASSSSSSGTTNLKGVHNDFDHASDVSPLNLKPHGSTCVPSLIYIIMVCATMMSFFSWTLIIVCATYRWKRTDPALKAAQFPFGPGAKDDRSGSLPGRLPVWWPWNVSQSPANGQLYGVNYGQFIQQRR